MSDEVKNYEFTTALAKIPITIDGEQYQIRELVKAGRTRYLKSLGGTMQVKMIGTGEKDKKGKETMRKEILITDLEGAQTELLKQTMFRVFPDKDPVPVSETTINTWPASLFEKLAKISSDLNKLETADEDLDKEAEKN